MKDNHLQNLLIQHTQSHRLSVEIPHDIYVWFEKLSIGDLENFIASAIVTQFKVLVGKSRVYGDIASIPTEELMNNSKYKTFPNRAEEIVRRAIKAILIYNSEIAASQAEKWGITQSTLLTLTGCNARSIAVILEKHKDDILSYNQSNGLDSRTHNRKPVKITKVVNLTQLVPDGL